MRESVKDEIAGLLIMVAAIIVIAGGWLYRASVPDPSTDRYWIRQYVNSPLEQNKRLTAASVLAARINESSDAKDLLTQALADDFYKVRVIAFLALDDQGMISMENKKRLRDDPHPLFREVVLSRSGSSHEH